MSAEDCILYRQIKGEWHVLGYGFTFDEADLDDDEFAKRSRIVPFDRLFSELELLSKQHYTEHGICYAGALITDPPPEVPREHRVLCCVPDGYKP